MSILIRKARETDLPQAAAIYDRILDRQERGLTYVGWLRGVYPTLATAQAAFQADEFFVLEDGGIVMASARINREQVDAYVQMDWAYPAPPDRVMVMHTLTVDPDRGGQGYGRAFVAFYEDYARKTAASACASTPTRRTRTPGACMPSWAIGRRESYPAYSTVSRG